MFVAPSFCNVFELDWDNFVAWDIKTEIAPGNSSLFPQGW